MPQSPAIRVEDAASSSRAFIPGSPPAPRLLTLGTLALRDAPSTPALGPRKLALLAYLALAARPLTRDHLAELFWGDRDDARARHSLREALSALRHVLGGHVVARGGELVALAGPALAVDARELRVAADAGDAARVLALHAGPFLDGVHLPGASPAFEDWVARERAEAGRCVADACAAECRRLRDAGDWTARAVVARRWTALAPLDPRAARALLRSLAAPGTRAALGEALGEYQRLGARLAADFALAPDPSVTTLAEEYARELAWHPGDGAITAPAPAAPPTSDVVPASDEVPAPNRARGARPGRRRAAVAALGLLALVGGAGWATHTGRQRATAAGVAPAPVDVGRPYVAVLATAGRAGVDHAWPSDALPHLIASALARAASFETTALPPDSSAAAGGVGATVLVRPTLARTERGYTLDLDVRAAGDGRPLRHAVVADSSVFALAEHAAVVLAEALGDSAVAAVGAETRSVDAYRAYLDALGFVGQWRVAEAAAALDRAVAADSGFVSAVAFRLRLINQFAGRAAADSAQQLADAMARHLTRATPYDRLDFQGTVASARGDHRRAEQLAAELVARYPHDEIASARYADLLAQHGRFEEALAETRRALRLDSLARPRRGATDRCFARCTVAGLLLQTGRVVEAEREARRAADAMPDRPDLWAGVSELLAARGRWDEAIAAAERARAARPLEPAHAFEAARRLVEAGRFDEAGAYLRPWRAALDRDVARAAADVEAARLRELGRHADAARVLAAWPRGRTPAPSPFDLVRGASLAAVGDEAGAVETYASPLPPPAARSRLVDARFWRQDARAFAWARALMADALVVAADARGAPADTLRLRALADSVEAVGAQSAYGRDWRLHHHVRGLIAAQGGRWEEASAQFSRARWGPVGWTRTLVELARAELVLGRPERALAALDAAQMAVLNSMGRYATRTEVALWKARAFHAAGAYDSARVYAAHVRRAWKEADPPIRRRLALLPPE